LLDEVAVALGAGLVGAFVVAPWAAQEVQRWIGWRVVLPLLLGRVPAWPEVKGAGGGTDLPYLRPIQVLTGTAFAVLGLRFGWSLSLVPMLILATGLVAISVVDIVCWRIPSRFVYLTGGGVLAWAAFAALVGGEPRSLVGAAIGAAVYLLFLGGLHLVSPRLLGFGDVRLGGLIGLGVGWMGWDPNFPLSEPVSWSLFALVVASLVGMMAGIVVLVVRWRQRRLSGRAWREPYPFGPWLCVGGLVTILLAAPGPV